MQKKIHNNFPEQKIRLHFASLLFMSRHNLGACDQPNGVNTELCKINKIQCRLHKELVHSFISIQ